MKYVALLRGINVGPNNRMSMTDLRRAFENLGYTSVSTVLQSGNVVFASARELSPAATVTLEDEIANTTGVQGRVLLLSAAQVKAVADANPLVDVATDHSRLLVTFLAEPAPDAYVLPPASDLAPEQVVKTDAAIYQWCPDGVSKTKVPARITAKLGPVATGRNWRTVQKLVELLDA